MNTLAPGSLLAQLHPANTTTATFFTATLRTEITSLLVCNTSGSAVTFRVHLDEQGTTYAVDNALYYDVSVPANTTVNLDAEMNAGIALVPGDTLGVRTGTASTLTFSAFGVTAPAR